jgi:prepilin-type processing-associated H-X9-DG protein
MPYHAQTNYPMPTGLGVNSPSYNNQNFQATVQWWMLPFVDQANMMKNWANSSWNHAYNYQQLPAPKVFACPSDPTASNGYVPSTNEGYTNYVLNMLIFNQNIPVKVPSSTPDGTSTTAYWFERYGLCANNTPRIWDDGQTQGNGPLCYWYTAPYNLFQLQPTASACSSSETQTGHSSGMNVGMADGSVRAVIPSITPSTWNAIITPNNKDTVGSDW